MGFPWFGFLDTVKQRDYVFLGIKGPGLAGSLSGRLLGYQGEALQPPSCSKALIPHKASSH